jgi:hypothetical protein
VPASAAGPDSQDPISSWGIDGRGLATAIIGNRVYVGGSFANAVSPTGATSAHANLAAFCLADGRLDTTFNANFAGSIDPMNPTTMVNALTTDGASLFVGGNFTTLNGAPVSDLVKLTADGARVTGFAPKPPQKPVLDLDYANGVVYAAGEFGKIGNPPVGLQNDVGFAAGFNSTSGVWTGWFAGADKKVESIAVSGGNVFIGGTFANVKGQARDGLAKLDTAGAGTLSSVNYGTVGARPFDLASPDGQTLYAAIGPAVGATGLGNRITSFGPTGAENWHNANLKGNGQAVELIGSTLFAGFLGGYDNPSNPLPLLPANYRVLGINPANSNVNNQITTFQPAVASATPDNGVFDLAQSPDRLVAVGDFTAVGNTGNLHGVAIFS